VHGWLVCKGCNASQNSAQVVGQRHTGAHRINTAARDGGVRPAAHVTCRKNLWMTGGAQGFIDADKARCIQRQAAGLQPARRLCARGQEGYIAGQFGTVGQQNGVGRGAGGALLQHGDLHSLKRALDARLHRRWVVRSHAGLAAACQQRCQCNHAVFQRVVTRHKTGDHS